ncbi:hypothetical protein GCM10009609_00260 [Pseudonocardia aurantiaca]
MACRRLAEAMAPEAADGNQQSQPPEQLTPTSAGCPDCPRWSVPGRHDVARYGDSGMGKAPEIDPIVAFMASDGGIVTRILTEHVSDRSGRCRVCGLGAQSGNQEWPCRLHGYASLASKLLPATKRQKPESARPAKRVEATAPVPPLGGDFAWRRDADATSTNRSSGG